MIEPGFAGRDDAPRGTFDFTAFSPTGQKAHFTVEAKQATVRYKVSHSELDWCWKTATVPCIRGGFNP